MDLPGGRLGEAEATDTIPANTFQAGSADSPALGTLKGGPVAIGNGPKKIGRVCCTIAGAMSNY
jgi:hypothetical protein